MQPPAGPARGAVATHAVYDLAPDQRAWAQKMCPHSTSPDGFQLHNLYRCALHSSPYRRVQRRAASLASGADVGAAPQVRRPPLTYPLRAT